VPITYSERNKNVRYSYSFLTRKLILNNTNSVSVNDIQDDVRSLHAMNWFQYVSTVFSNCFELIVIFVDRHNININHCPLIHVILYFVTV